MPKCNICSNSFDVEKEPGALLFSHPSSVKKICKVKKYHICQKCEKGILTKRKARRLSEGEIRKAIEEIDFNKNMDMVTGAKKAWFSLSGLKKIAHAIFKAQKEME